MVDVSGQASPVSLPPEAEKVTVYAKPDGVYVGFDFLNSEGEILETHEHAIGGEL